MPEKPLLSIITVNLNNLHGLKRTMESVLNQTSKSFEYIIIDGGSVDGSKNLIEKYNNELAYWVSEKDKGIFHAMNKGITKSNGSYLLFLNSGDELFNPTVLEKNIKKVRKEDLIYFDICLVDNNSEKIHQYPVNLDYKYLIKSSLGHPTTFINKNLFDRVGLYDESLKIVADWKFFIKSIIKYGCTYRKVDAVLSKFYMDGISAKNISKVDCERNKVLNAEFKDYLRLKELEEKFEKLRHSLIMRILNKLGLVKL